ncbi:unnamed protein product [Rotaria sp. Silwood2]|nr:unnamed protein product [Rotaria sp. Silwood2]CAF4085477.1 unnamed protein product [Rotaria sp. Silwood2]
MIFEDTTTSFTNNFLTDIDMASLNEIPLPTNSTMSEPIQIISTQRGKRKLLLDGYIYRLDRSNDRGIEQWRCSKKSCRGRIHLHNSFLFSSTINRTNVTLVSSHSHASEPAQCEAAIVIDHIRTSAQHNQHESPKDIVHRLLRSVSNETAANLPSITAMQRSIQRRRQQQKLLDSFLLNIEHEENLTPSDIQILYRSINDNSLSYITELAHNQILVLTCENEHNYRNKLANTSVWLCTTFHEQYKRIIHDMEYKSTKYLLALAYIPQSDIIMGFEALHDIYSSSIEGIYDKFEDLCIGRLRPNGHRSQPLFTANFWNWIDVIPQFDNLLLINTNIKQWDDMFRVSCIGLY